MKVTVIGSGTGVPSLRRGAPALLVESQKKKLLFDGGSGTLRQLLRVGTSVHDVDAIFVTHLHPDHTADLVPFLFASKYTTEGTRTKELSIIGPHGLNRFYEGLKAVYGNWIVPESYPFTVREVVPGELPFHNLTVRASGVLHTDKSLGYRLQSPEGKSMVYSGDTDYCESIVSLAKGAHLLILECSFPDGMKVEGHLTPSLAGRIAHEAGCHKLVLTHLYPPCDRQPILEQAKKAFAGDVAIAEDLMELRI
jgi:ribonuclease BN (tRNA processing enzyme)